ncbi:MAG: glycosyltransferase [Candidatus Marinimicrobia bacterium]|nr:glycosyltransferase [Candidatus Neomarinimicrobiota bacterium]
MSEFLFSIIVPSFNRSGELVELIESFNALEIDKSKFEVIIVDDGSTDETEKLIENFIHRMTFQIRFFKRDHEGPGPARNFGMAQAAGEYFLFIDSDCIADKNWLKELEKAIESEKPDAFGGPDGVLPNFTPLQKAIDYSMTSFLTTGGMRGHSKKKLAKYYPRSFNMGIKRTIYETLGGMGTLRHGQDLEFSRRIVASGAKVIPIPDAKVYHKRRTSLKKFFRQMFNWGVARINLTMLDQGILEPLHFIPAIGSVGYTLLTLFTLLTGVTTELWTGATLLAFLLFIFIIYDSFKKYKDSRAALLSPVVAVCQVFAYGYGFTINYIRRKILGKDEYTGFVKKYYK